MERRAEREEWAQAEFWVPIALPRGKPRGEESAPAAAPPPRGSPPWSDDQPPPPTASATTHGPPTQPRHRGVYPRGAMISRSEFTAQAELWVPIALPRG
ncbi:MAG: hypothetical protein PHO37_14835 [Kiritimatiellae bacterium]|nr:hypothetical protein [Kiritimatiellia bacterium]